MATITLRSKVGRLVCVLAELLVFLALAVWIVRSYSADRTARRVDAASLERAIRYDPGNAEYHLRLGRVNQYSITDVNPELAVELLKRAAELNPRNPQPWLELSAAYGFQGNADAAETCLLRADRLAPRLPSIQWVIGNFFLLQGNTDQAFKHFQVVLAGTHQFDQILFRTAWKASEDPQKILDELIPRKVATEFGYLYFLLQENRLAEALTVWQRIAASGERFDAARVTAFLDRLISARLPSEAGEVWSDLVRTGLIPPTHQPAAQNLIVNGDIEEEILNLGFDWRITKVEGVHVTPDGSVFHSPSRALQISFNGKSNLYYLGLYQFVRVEPGRSYQLKGYLRTESITTDSGPRLRVQDAYDASQLQKFSESVTGSSGGWNQIILDFTAGPRSELVVVGVARLPSRKLDNQIAGTVWVDDVSLSPVR